MTGTVTKWIRQLEKGDPAAAQSLFDHFFDDLVRRCRARLAGKPPRATDGEDVAVQALASFFRKATDKDFPQLDDRHDLWKLLLAIAGNKAKSLLRDENRQKRGGGRVVGENVLSGGNSIEGWNLDWEMGNVETPEMKAQLRETMESVFASLPDDELRRILELKLDGYRNTEIVEKTGLSLATVERRLRRIRDLLAGYFKNSELGEEA